MIFADRIVASSSEMIHTRRYSLPAFLCGCCTSKRSTVQYTVYSLQCCELNSLALTILLVCVCVRACVSYCILCLLFIKYHRVKLLSIVLFSFPPFFLIAFFVNIFEVARERGSRERRERKKENQNDTLLSSVCLWCNSRTSWA